MVTNFFFLKRNPQRHQEQLNDFDVSATALIAFDKSGVSQSEGSDVGRCEQKNIPVTPAPAAATPAQRSQRLSLAGSRRGPPRQRRWLATFRFRSSQVFRS